MSDHETLLAAQKSRLDQLTGDIFYAFEGVAIDERSREAGLWQGGYIPRQMDKVNELRELFGLPPLETIFEPMKK